MSSVIQRIVLTSIPFPDMWAVIWSLLSSPFSSSSSSFFLPQEFMVGLNFASEDEAEKFRTAVESKITYARRASKPQKPSPSYLPSPLSLSQLWRGNLLPRPRNLWLWHLPCQITETHTVWVVIAPKKGNQTNQKGRNWPKLTLASQLNLGKGKRERERDCLFIYLLIYTHFYYNIIIIFSLSHSLSLSLTLSLSLSVDIWLTLVGIHRQVLLM